MKIILFFQTLCHVKPIQLYFQLYYKVINKVYEPTISFNYRTQNIIEFTGGLHNATSYEDGPTFTFLNKSNAFNSIDWNFSDYGKLWTYNLNYFDFLQQESVTKEVGLNLMYDFCSKSHEIKDGFEPYPISLRVINWVKFLSRNKICDVLVDKQLHSDLQRLNGHLEYHLLANHLFENGFGLLFGAYYFQDEQLYKSAVTIIRSELKEQILSDGAHYELTPMYHQIILHRILDCYQLVSMNVWKNHELASVLKDAASRMLGWLNNMQFSSGELPLVNDSANNIAATPSELNAYAKELGIIQKLTPLNESGYRIFKSDDFELLMDVGQIAPSYQPGHAHADSLQFILHYNRKPIIVDTGISTYEKNERRQLERSTSSHNTITVDKKNSSQVWSGFRVGKRARVKILGENENLVVAEHDGYRGMGISCRRKLHIFQDEILITDQVFGKTKGKLIEGHLHFHPQVLVEIYGNEVCVDNEIKFIFRDVLNLEMLEYFYCQGFNQIIPAKKFIYSFQESCAVLIQKA